MPEKHDKYYRMAQQLIAPIVPNVSPQGEAIAGSSAVIFTASDRQIIKERAGEIERGKSFKEIFFKREITPKVENEQSTVKPEQDLKALENRRREHRRMLKHSPLTLPQEHVEITEQTPEELLQPTTLEHTNETVLITPSYEKVELGNKQEFSHKTEAILKELNLNPNELYNKLSLEQEELHSLVYRIKELHLKRLLSTSPKEFEKLTEEIKNSTLASAKPEAREWLTQQLDQLTRRAAEYKINLIKSLQSIHLETQRENLKWLEKITTKLLKN